MAIADLSWQHAVAAHCHFLLDSTKLYRQLMKKRRFRYPRIKRRRLTHTKTNLFTLPERKSRFIVAIKNESRRAPTTFNTLVNYMKNKLHETVQTLTLDNDPAFALHEQVTETFNSPIYFCEPYKSYQKGGVENANKLIRTQLPSRTKIDDLA